MPIPSPELAVQLYNRTHECKEIMYPHALDHVIDMLVVTYDRIMDGHLLVLYLRV